MKLLILLVVLANTVYMAYCLCGVCSLTNFACVDVDKFAVCSGNKPQLPGIKCPNGTVCTASSPVCVNKNEVDELECDSCNKCNNVFACKSYNTFSLCYGSSQPNQMYEYTCPGNLVCNLESPTICSDPDGLGSTCPISTLVTTPAPTTTHATETTIAPTINPATNPKEFCASQSGRGRYDVLSDKKCSQYINCYQSNGQWKGNIYLCPSGTYFNQTSQMCGTNVPPRCSSTLAVCD